MIGALIADGDVVILKKREEQLIKDGTIVAARVGSQTTLKYYKQLDRETIRLEPANPDYSSIDVRAEELDIQGVFVGSMRNLI